MNYLIILAILIILVLAARLLSLRRELKRIAADLAELSHHRSRQKLTVSMRHQPLEKLCEQVNRELADFDKARIDAENHEAALRTQIANISHDLRTPLTAISGYISMAKAAPERAPDYLEIMENRAKALQILVEQFYELSILEDARTEMQLAAVDVTAVLTECLLGHYALFEEKGVTFQASLPEQAVMIIGNVPALERIFQNLLQNALKYANSNIAVTLTEAAVFTVTNDAENLTEADVDHLFERFYTADPARTVGNTGLGLYIVKRLLEKTKGHLGRVTLVEGLFTLEICFLLRR